jgi:hypothetical protein
MYSSRDMKNIPVSISLLHEQEYNNLYLILNNTNGNIKKRRAFSERSSDYDNELIQIKRSRPRRKTLKN